MLAPRPFLLILIYLPNSFRTASAELPTLSTTRCKASRETPSALVQYATSSFAHADPAAVLRPSVAQIVCHRFLSFFNAEQAPEQHFGSGRTPEADPAASVSRPVSSIRDWLTAVRKS